jgi:hypothetical protein
MKKFASRGLRAACVVLVAAVAASAASAQEAITVPAEESPGARADDSWYYRSAPERTATVRPAVQKAQQRAAQRMARLDAQRWYGFSNSRPTAAAIPWTTMYRPAWQTPGGRPFAWYTSFHRPVVVINAAPMYR